MPTDIKPWLDQLEVFFTAASAAVWGMPLVILLLGGGLFFVIYSRALPYRHFGHALGILSGRYDDPREPGDITHLQALSSALSGTLGLGNIAGVAVAIHVGGPGALVWMWLTALVGVATKFFTGSLAIMYRGHDADGHPLGGPMYVIEHGLGQRWRPLALFFAACAVIGTLPSFQANQLTQIVRHVIAEPQGWSTPDQHLIFDLLFGSLVAVIVAYVIFGNIRRIGRTAERLVPAMVALYLLITVVILTTQAAQIPAALSLIFTDAFTGQALTGGILGMVIIGVRQGVFSNEAGVGTESLAHGAAKTHEPIREGLVAMLGPVIDTLIVCTCTGLMIVTTGVWRGEQANGVELTALAFSAGLGPAGPWLLTLVVIVFSISTMFTFWYYGSKCLNYLFGTSNQTWYRYAYLLLIIIGAMVSVDTVVGLISAAYGLMAIPTMFSTLLLAPKVMSAARDYFNRLPRI